MKKALSIFLSVLMIMSCFAFAISAAEIDGGCNCTDHKPASTGDKCHCCVFCDNIEKTYLTSCVKFNEDGTVTVCCHYCDGIYPCGCGCDCCPDDEQTATSKPILTEEQQDKVVSTFQKIMSRFVEWFDNFFNTIFEFLRLDEILGTNN